MKRNVICSLEGNKYSECDQNVYCSSKKFGKQNALDSGYATTKSIALSLLRRPDNDS